GLQTEHAVDRAFETDGRWMERSGRREAAARAIEAHDRQFGGALSFVQHCHVHGAGIAPQAEQTPVAVSKLTRDRTPALLVDDEAWMRAMTVNFAPRDRVDHARHGQPNTFATF